MFECETAEEWISAAIDGELSEQARVAMNSHLVSCDACQKMYSEWVQLSQFVRIELSAMEAPSNIESRVQFGLRATADKHDLIRVNWAAILLFSLLSAVCAALFASPFGRIAWSVVKLIGLGLRTSTAHLGGWMSSIMPTSTPVIFVALCFCMAGICTLLVIRIHQHWRTAS